MFDPLSKAAYDAAILEHNAKISSDLQRIDAALGANGGIAPTELARLRTMRVLLLSGLFDRNFYLERNADIREAQVDPLEHYVMHGDAEGRLPNPAFFPSYYRREFMSAEETKGNALEHYIKEGECSGGKPNSFFDPCAYLAANPALSASGDSALFHYLKIGRVAGEKVCGAPPDVVLPALEYAEAIIEGMQAKRALFEKLGPGDGFTLYKQIVGRPDHAEIHRKRLGGLREISQKSLGTFRETAPAGEPFMVPPPAVRGEGKLFPLEGCTRSMFVACLVDARVRARSNIIEVDDVAVLDCESEELARYDDQLDFDPTVFQATLDEAWILTPKGDASTVQLEEAFTLLGVRPEAFGHWMIEYLPKYVAASMSGALPRVPILIDGAMPPSHRQALELMVPEGTAIIEVAPFDTVHVRRLWCAPSQALFPIAEENNERFRWEYFALPPPRMAPIIREMARRVERATAGETGFDRVFLARESTLHHKLVNHTAIEAAAKARGFHVAYPQQLDFSAQARLVRDARFLIAPDGSQTFLAFFARPGTKLCILSNPEGLEEIQAEHGALYTEIGINYTILTGPCVRLDDESPWESDYEIDEQALCRFLDQWLE
jgi:hypothetical protein